MNTTQYHRQWFRFWNMCIFTIIFTTIGNIDIWHLKNPQASKMLDFQVMSEIREFSVSDTKLGLISGLLPWQVANSCCEPNLEPICYIQQVSSELTPPTAAILSSLHWTKNSIWSYKMYKRQHSKVHHFSSLASIDQSKHNPTCRH